MLYMLLSRQCISGRNDQRRRPQPLISLMRLSLPIYILPDHLLSLFLYKIFLIEDISCIGTGDLFLLPFCFVLHLLHAFCIFFLPYTHTLPPAEKHDLNFPGQWGGGGSGGGWRKREGAGGGGRGQKRHAAVSPWHFFMPHLISSYIVSLISSSSSILYIYNL